MTHADAPLSDSPEPPSPAIAAAPEHNPAHADYNLDPLPVNGLDHYVKHEEDERFHVC